MKKTTLILCALALCFVCSSCVITDSIGADAPASVPPVYGADSIESAIEEYYIGQFTLDAQRVINVTQFCDGYIETMKSSLDADALRAEWGASMDEQTYNDPVSTISANFSAGLIDERECLEKYLSSTQETSSVRLTDDDIQVEFIYTECPAVNDDAWWLDSTVNQLEKYGMPHMDTGYAKFNITILPTGDVATETNYMFKLKDRWYVYNPSNWHYYVD